MSCFWDGLRSKLKITHVDNVTFVKHLQSQNTSTHTGKVLWNKIKLTKQCRLEHYHHIKHYDLAQINHGYLCSSCDAFLVLICALFQTNIHHNFNGNVMTYELPSATSTIYCQSNSNHFY